MRDIFATLPRLKGPVEAPAPQPVRSGSAINALSGLRVNRPSEWERILALPLDTGLSEEEVAEVSRWTVKPEAYQEGFRLLLSQAWAWVALNEYNGFCGKVDVGWGKTIMTLLAAAHYWKNKHRKTMLIMPPNVWEQLNLRDIPAAQQTIHLFGTPFIRLAGLSRLQRQELVQSNAAGCYLMPYSLLSTTDGYSSLMNIAPTAIILDEAHYVVPKKSARTRRLFDYIRRQKPYVCALSGTLTQKGLMDFHHILVCCLGARAPIPLLPSDAMDWAQIVDSGAEPTGRGLSYMVPLLSWAQKVEPESFANESNLMAAHRKIRLAFQLRLRTAPGMISVGDKESIGTSLTMCNKPSKLTEGFEEIERLMKKVSEEYETPNGDPIDHAIHTYAWMRQLSAGFWYKLHWPSEDVCAPDILERSRIYHDLEIKFLRGLRSWLQHEARPHLDTPLLVRSSMDRKQGAEVGEGLYTLWKSLKNADFDGRIERISVPVRVCDYKLRDAMTFANEFSHGIIWYEHRELGAWMSELLTEAAIPHVHCKAGKQGNQDILNSRGKLVVASVKAHSEGKNLQFHTNQFCLQFPREAKTAEQLLGRTLRYGQTADYLDVHTCLTTEHDYMAFAAMLIDSLYVVLTTGSRRKVIFCNYDPLPKIFPPEVLMERGFHDLSNLSASGLKALQKLNPQATESK